MIKRATFIFHFCLLVKQRISMQRKQSANRQFICKLPNWEIDSMCAGAGKGHWGRCSLCVSRKRSRFLQLPCQHHTEALSLLTLKCCTRLLLTRLCAIAQDDIHTYGNYATPSSRTLAHREMISLLRKIQLILYEPLCPLSWLAKRIRCEILQVRRPGLGIIILAVQGVSARLLALGVAFSTSQNADLMGTFQSLPADNTSVRRARRTRHFFFTLKLFA